MNPIEAYLGPARVVILTTTDAFGAKHVCAPFNALSLVQTGAPYEPHGTSWVRYNDLSGAVKEDRVSDFAIRTRFDNGFDGVLLSPFRTYPPEAIEPLATVAVGDSVLVHSKAHGTTVTATVTAVAPYGGNYTIGTTYPAISGDSGSLVTTPEGTFVGFVSALTDSGSLISVPPVPAAPVSLPAPVAIPPPVLPVVGVEAEAFARGILEGKRQAVALVQATIG